MATSICTSGNSLLQKKAQRDALGIEILFYEVTRPFVVNYYVIKLYLATLKLRKYLEKYDLNVCAACHGIDECAKYFYESDKTILNVLSEKLPNIQKRKILWLFINLPQLLQNCKDKLEERIEDMEFIFETRDGILDEIASALDKAEPHLPNWHQSLSFLQ